MSAENRTRKDGHMTARGDVIDVRDRDSVLVLGGREGHGMLKVGLEILY